MDRPPLSLDEPSWQDLLDHIAAKDCTPFIGAGMSPHPGAKDIAEQWAKDGKYPLSDRTDLARVAQFVAIGSDGLVDGTRPRRLLKDLFANTTPPDYKDRLEPHGLLADLALPMYITTNYDRFMTDALEDRGRGPNRVVCRWNDAVPRSPFPKPSQANPLVFHLHGHDEIPKSMVLTEDDYFDFLVRSQRDPRMIPDRVKEALSGTLLFLGYSLGDWTFRVLLRGLLYSLPNSLKGINVAVQLRKGEPEENYLYKYFKNMNVRVYFGKAIEFASEFRNRWDEYNGGK